MPIRFTCPSCGRVLSTASRKLGRQIDCPACYSSVTVAPLAAIAESPPSPSPKAETPRVFHTAEALPAPRSHSWLLPAGGVMVLVVGVVIWLAIRDPSSSVAEPAKPVAQSTERPKIAQPAPKPAEPPASAKPSEEPTQTTALPKPPATESRKPAADPERTTLVTKQPEAEPVKPVDSTPVLQSFAPAPKEQPALPPPAVEIKPATFRPRSEFSDEDLRKQLLEAPEVSLDLRSAQAVLNFSRLSIQQGRDGDGATLLLKQRPDLHALPMRMGNDCHLGKEPAENLQVLSRKLRTFVEASIPKESADVRPNADRLREYLLGSDNSVSVNSVLAGRRVTNMASGGPKEWLVPEAIPTLQQLLMAESKSLRLLLVDLLAQIKGKEATVALAQRAVFDLSSEVREAATNALRGRPLDEIRPTLVGAFRYPWAPAADHAAESLVKLDDKEAVPQLAKLLKEPDPKLPAIQQRRGRPIEAGPDLSQAPAGLREVSAPKDTHLVREVVRINHLSNCLMCHAASFDAKDDVRGRVPIPGQPVPSFSTPQYYEGNTGTFVRADITYLKQDFSVNQPVANAGVWPNQQRYDYLVRTRMPTVSEMNELANYKLLAKQGKAPSYPQREAALCALRYLTGKDAGTASEDWECLVRAEE